MRKSPRSRTRVPDANATTAGTPASAASRSRRSRAVGEQHPPHRQQRDELEQRRRPGTTGSWRGTPGRSSAVALRRARGRALADVSTSSPEYTRRMTSSMDGSSTPEVDEVGQRASGGDDLPGRHREPVEAHREPQRCLPGGDLRARQRGPDQVEVGGGLGLHVQQPLAGERVLHRLQVAVEDDPALVDDDEPPAEALDVAEVVAGQHDRGALVPDLRKNSRTRSLTARSSPIVGSSRYTIGGSCSSAAARSARIRWPSDSLPADDRQQLAELQHLVEAGQRRRYVAVVDAVDVAQHGQGLDAPAGPTTAGCAARTAPRSGATLPCGPAAAAARRCAPHRRSAPGSR